MRPVFWSAVLTAMILFSACDSGGDEAERGRYRLTLTGDIEASHEGPAVFSRDRFESDPESSDLVTVTLIQPGGIGFLGLGFDGQPEAGTYTIGSAELGAPSAFYVDQSRDSRFLTGDAGTVTITASTDDRLAGSFDVSLNEGFVAEGDPETTVQATGTFDAVFRTTVVATSTQAAGREARPNR